MKTHLPIADEVLCGSGGFGALMLAERDICKACLRRSGSPFVRDNEVYDAGWWFQKREDAYAFVRLYGGVAE